MGKLADVVADSVAELFGFVAASVKFALGLIAVIICVALLDIGEVLDDVKTYNMIDWFHIVKELAPFEGAAIVSYFKLNNMLQIALQTPPPPAPKV